MKRLLVSSIAAVALLTACGVAEDTTAATVNGQDISVSAVTKLAKSKYIVDTASAGGLVSSKDVVVGSTTRRAALGLLVQSEVYEAGIAARKGEITDVDRDAAEAQISDYESNNQTTIDDTARPVIVRLIAAQAALGRILGGADIESAASPEKIEAYFDEHADEFAKICVDGFAVTSDQAAAAQAAVDRGDDIAAILADSSLQAQSLSQTGTETCVLSGQVSDSPLADLITTGPVGQWSSTDISDATAGDLTVFVRPNSRDEPTLDDPDISDQIAQQLQSEATSAAQEAFGAEAETILKRADVEIDSRYGRWDPSDPSLILAPLAPTPSAKAAAEALSADDLAGLQGQ